MRFSGRVWTLGGGVSVPARQDFLDRLLPNLGTDTALAWLDGDDVAPYLLRFDPNSDRIAHDVRLPFGPLWLTIPAGCRLDRDTDPDRYIIRGDESAGHRITLGDRPGGGARPLHEQVVAIGVAPGADAGIVTFTTSIPADDILATSIRYFYPAPPVTDSATLTAEPVTDVAPPPVIGAFVYPLFSPALPAANSAPPEATRIQVRLHPGRPTDTTANVLTLLSPGAYPTTFRSIVGRTFTLATIPDRSRLVPQWDPVTQESYLTLDGDWRLSAMPTTRADAPGDLDVIGGLSGLEYAKVADASILRFVAGAPAYAPNFRARLNQRREADPGDAPLTPTCPGSEYPVTTAWVYFADDLPATPGATGPPAPRGYYAQPDAGGLFHLNSGDPFLGVLQLQTASFPPDAQPVFGAPAPSVPMAPYAGVQIADRAAHELYTRFEAEVLSPTRGNAIYAMNWPQAAARAAAHAAAHATAHAADLHAAHVAQPTPGSRPAPGLQPMPGLRPGAGPRGLVDPCSKQTAGAASEGSGPIGLTGVTGPLAVTPQGLLATFSPDYSVWRQLVLASTVRGLKRLELRDLCQPLKSALLTNQLFLVISDPTALADCCEVIFPGLTMGGWSFTLEPKQWRANTVMLFKFADQPLEQLIDDRALWSAPGSTFNSGAATQRILQRAVEYARANRGQPEFDYFLDTVLKDWNGILFFNLAVPPGDFPEQLRGLASGIDFRELTAHHLGVNLSPIDVRDGLIRTADSSLFGLIDYNDPQDLTYLGRPYDFKVLSLRVLFANSDIASFASQIELLVGTLFGERSTLRDSLRGDNLVLNGVWQRHGGEDSYTFTEQGADTFVIDSHVLDTVLISKAQFVTLPADPTDPSIVATRFVLWGSLRFKALAEADIFSFGPQSAGDALHGLQFSNLFVSMTSHRASEDPNEKTFAFQAGQMVFDLAASTPRPGSLYARFPLQVVGLAQGDQTTTPADLGYIAMQSPLTGASIGSTWFGLDMTLSLGSPGSLASKAGFSATMLVAWSPNANAYAAFVGIRLPGSESGKRSLTIQGPLTLNIGSLALLHDAVHGAYLMRFDNIALGFFGLKFPPGGRTNLMVFGDPESGGRSTTLGWYAAYKKDKKEEAKEKDTPALVAPVTDAPRLTSGSQER